MKLGPIALLALAVATRLSAQDPWAFNLTGSADLLSQRNELAAPPAQYQHALSLVGT